MEGPRKGGLKKPSPNYFIFPGTMTTLRMACWNIRTLASQLDFDSRKTAQLNNELLRLNIDILAISETHLLQSGNIKEKDYTIFWNGRLDVQREGVGFAIKNTLIPCCSSPVAHSSRLMSIRIKTTKGWINLLSVYASTLDADNKLMDLFYSGRKKNLCSRNAKKNLCSQIWQNVLLHRDELVQPG